MKSRLMVYALLAISLLTARSIAAQTPAANDNGSVKVIEISAKKYEFTPSEITVKKGTRVQLKVHSVDETHGAKLSVIPEGSSDKTPGLKFDHPDENGKVEKGTDQILEFVAEKPGIYEFKCAKLCGMGHGRMKGKLVVAE